jgi:hypothetical protein
MVGSRASTLEEIDAMTRGARSRGKSGRWDMIEPFTSFILINGEQIKYTSRSRRSKVEA